MKTAFRRVFAALLSLCLLLPCLPSAQAEEDPGMAQNITSTQRLLDCRGMEYAKYLFDGDTTQDTTGADGTRIKLGYKEGMGFLYLIFNVPYGTYTVTNEDTGETKVFGQEGFLNSYVDLEGAFGTAPTVVTVTFNSGPVHINELFIYSTGTVPDHIQRWEAPKEDQTDMILFSTHGDDEQLFFAGLLPYYGGELDYEILVVYLTDHHNRLGPLRRREMLAGLWAVGITTYPVFGPFSDLYCESKEDAYGLHKNMGETEEELQGFVVEQLRRFKPLVTVGHDPVGGEYGHGQHMMYAELLCNALELAQDPEQFPESAELYGTWDVPKTYLHLLEENQIVLDWDHPLETFGGMTAFQVTKELGFSCHRSQQDAFAWYMANIENAAEIPQYSPCQYGLYRSTVGPDVEKNDMFENLRTYAQQEEDRIRAEEEAAAAAAAATATTAPPETTVPPTTLPPQTEPPAIVPEAGFPYSLLFAGLALAAAAIFLVLSFRKK